MTSNAKYPSYYDLSGTRYYSYINPNANRLKPNYRSTALHFQECVGELLSKNQSLTCLDVSGNYLGKDYFSRCVGPALAANSTLQMLKYNNFIEQYSRLLIISVDLFQI